MKKRIFTIKFNNDEIEILFNALSKKGSCIHEFDLGYRLYNEWKKQMIKFKKWDAKLGMPK
jgi:hypothetical protein